LTHTALHDGVGVIVHTGAMSDGGEPIIDLENLLNPEEQRRFRRLCLDTSPEELEQLGSVVELHLDLVRQNAGPHTDTDAATEVAGALTSLLQSGEQFDASERSLVRGAVEYFLLDEDASSDIDDVLGFDDDARVVNSVLKRVGKQDLVIDLGR